MRHVDFAPLYRSTVGFDRLFSMLDNMSQPDNGQTYPPYNIERTGENAYRITMAVAGFGESDLSIESRENTLTVKGEKTDADSETEVEYLHRGPRLRASLSTCRPCGGEGRELEERPAPCGPGPGDPGGHEAAQDRDLGRRQQQ